MAEAIHAKLRALDGGGCALESVDTVETRVAARWTRAGRALPEATLTFGECEGARGWHVELPPALGESCPEVARGLAGLAASLRAPAAGWRLAAIALPLALGFELLAWLAAWAVRRLRGRRAG